MDKSVFNIFSFILYIVGLLFLVGVLFIIASNLIFFYLINTDLTVSLETNVLFVMLGIALVIYVLFSIPACIAYNNEVLNNKNDLTVIILAPIIGFKFIIKFLRNK